MVTNYICTHSTEVLAAAAVAEYSSCFPHQKDLGTKLYMGLSSSSSKHLSCSAQHAHSSLYCPVI